jgi:multimeric flavodoxin WrbA
MKKVLIISASPRLNGNSDLLARSFEKGAKASGHEVTYIRLSEKKIGYCLGCYYCASHDGHCVQKDDAEAIVDAMIEADVIVFATPTYFYSVDGQLKTLIDRTVMKYTRMLNKEVYYLITSWDPEKTHLEKVVEAIRGFTTDCLEGAKEKGIILATGVTEKGEITKTDYLIEAEKMGKSI